jgi:4-hydroxy-4-methyl-2-oxoglutarate aldolase
MGKLGFRVLPNPTRIAAEVLDQYRGMASSNIADAMGRFGFMRGIQARSGLAMCGLAVTVRSRPADNLMIHKALHVATPGDVIVVDTCGNETSAVFGELMCHSAVAARVGGIVVDGAIRDVDGITALGLPAFSRTVCPGGCDKDGPGEINVPICCGGTVVMPGDIIVGDADGVAVVPSADAEEVLTLVAHLMDRERKRMAEIHAGHVFRSDVDELLRAKGAIA